MEVFQRSSLYTQNRYYTKSYIPFVDGLRRSLCPVPVTTFNFFRSLQPLTTFVLPASFRSPLSTSIEEVFFRPSTQRSFLLMPIPAVDVGRVSLPVRLLRSFSSLPFVLLLRWVLLPPRLPSVPELLLLPSIIFVPFVVISCIVSVGFDGVNRSFQ